MTENIEILSGLYLPVADKFLLVPNVSVAEIIDFQTPIQHDGNPDWCLGSINWRGLTIPVISYPAANGGSPSPVGQDTRIAVINTISSEHHKKLPFFALVTQGIPRQVKLDEKSIEQDPDELGQADLMSVRALGDEAIIPNIEFLETLAIQVSA